MTNSLEELKIRFEQAEDQQAWIYFFFKYLLNPVPSNPIPFVLP